MEKNMEQEMETGLRKGFIGVITSSLWSSLCDSGIVPPTLWQLDIAHVYSPP